MANPTQLVPSGMRRYEDTKRYLLFAQIADSYYPNEMVGRRNSDGMAFHFDDSVPMRFEGFFEGPQWKPSTDLPTAGFERLVNRPMAFSMPLASGTASRLTDIGKPVFAVNSGAVTTNPLATVNANMVGHISDIDVADPATMTGANVWIQPAYYGLGRLDTIGILTAPATGGATYGVEVLNRMVEVPNTAAETLNLPPVSSSVGNDHIVFVKTTVAAFAITIAPNGTDTINGANASVVIPAVQWARLSLTSDGTQWIVSAATNSNTGLLLAPPGATVQTLITGGAITLPSGSAKALTNAGAITGVTLAAGITDGQILLLTNQGTGSITFAAAGTSLVADGASAILAVNQRMLLLWVAAVSLWYHGN